jgi:predicted transcriptional regulator
VDTITTTAIAGDIFIAASGVARMHNVVYTQNILYKPNMSKARRAEPDRRFIEDVARLLVPWGVSQTAARLYGYLLLELEPVSLDCITADLEISKTSASVAARLLEQYTLVRRPGERGSKRALYEASDNYESVLTGQSRLLEALAELLRTGAGNVASGRTRDRLKEIAEFNPMMRDAMNRHSAAGAEGGELDVPDPFGSSAIPDAAA